MTTIHRYAVRLKSTASRIVSRVPFLFMQLSSVVEREQTGPTSLAADYGLYGWVVEGKFSTSQIQLVLLDLRVVSRLTLPMVDSWPARLRFQLVGL